VKAFLRFIAGATAVAALAAGPALVSSASGVSATSDSQPGDAWTAHFARFGASPIGSTPVTIAIINGLPPGSYTVNAVANVAIGGVPSASHIGVACSVVWRGGATTPSVVRGPLENSDMMAVPVTAAFTTTVQTYVRLICSASDDTVVTQPSQLVVTMVNSVTRQPQ
jgi:hypothetical protein